MIFIHASAEEELCESAVVLRTSVGTSSEQEVCIVQLKGSHLEVVRDAISEIPVSSDTSPPETERVTTFALDTFGRIWNIQVIFCQSSMHSKF